MPRRRHPRLDGEAARLAYEQAEPRPYPYEKDETHAGRMATVPGRRGWFRVLAHETNPDTGSSWWSLMGPRHKGDPGQYTAVREINLVPERRARKRGVR